MLKCKERSLLNGHVNCTNDNFYESSCLFECNKGYELIGSFENKCVVDVNGIVNWNNQSPTCTSKYCFFKIACS